MIKVSRLRSGDSSTARVAVAKVLGAAASEEHLQGFLGSDLNYLFISEDGSGVTGALLAYELVRVKDAGSKIFLYEIGVLERARRRGAGTALIAALLEAAREKGALSVFGLTNPAYPGAVDFYRSTGAAIRNEHEILFEYPIGGR